MFPHGYFPAGYFSPNYWPPIEEGPGGGAPIGEEGEGVEESTVQLPDVISIVSMLREQARIRKERLATDEEDAILLLLLSDLFGSIGGYPLQSKVIKDLDDEALLLLLGNQWPI